MISALPQAVWPLAPPYHPHRPLRVPVGPPSVPRLARASPTVTPTPSSCVCQTEAASVRTRCVTSGRTVLMDPMKPSVVGLSLFIGFIYMPALMIAL